MARKLRLTALKIAAPLLALLVAGDFIAWKAATTRLQSNLASLTTDMRASGWTVQSSDPETGGWPFAAALTLKKLRIEGAGAAIPGGLAWSVDRIVLSIRLFDPRRLAIAPFGEETLRLSHLPVLDFDAESLEALIPLGSGRPRHAALTAEGLAGGLQASRRRQDVQIGTLSVSGQAQSSRGGIDATGDFAATGIALPDTGRWPLGGLVKHLSASATLISPPVTGASSRAQAQSWHDGLGFLRIHALDLRWGPLLLQGDAQLGLDGKLQPAGSGTIHVAGYGEALDALASAHVIGPGLAATYKALLEVMAPPGAPLNVKVTLRDSTLFVGEIPLARVADVGWK